MLDARAMQAGAKYRRCKGLSDMLFRALAALGAATIRPDFRGGTLRRQMATSFHFAVSSLQPVGRRLGGLGA